MSGAGSTGSGISSRKVIAAVRAAVVVSTRAPVASAARSTRLVVNSIPASSASRLLAFENGASAPTRATIAASPGESDPPATPSSSSSGSTPCPQAGQW